MSANRETVQLRNYLREATAEKHDVLDRSVAQGSLTDRDRYTAFLQRQYLARRPIELWFAEGRDEFAPPPPTAQLIAADLDSLCAPVPAAAEDFVMPCGADALGAAWAIAGSQLGNRAMLGALRKAGADLPTAFLGDMAMTDYWKSLRPRLEVEVQRDTADRAVLAADAVFAHFLLAFADDRIHRLAA